MTLKPFEQRKRIGCSTREADQHALLILAQAVQPADLDRIGLGNGIIHCDLAIARDRNRIATADAEDGRAADDEIVSFLWHGPIVNGIHMGSVRRASARSKHFGYSIGPLRVARYTLGMQGPTQSDPGHIPVLLNEVLSLLDLDEAQPGVVFLDCTLGRGGHASHIIPRIGPGGIYVGLDLDGGNLAYAGERLKPIAEQHDVTLHLVNETFAGARNVLESLGIASVDRVLADLGFASNQVDDPERGLSFKHNGPLDMRLDPNGPTTAADLVNRMSEKELADVIYLYGEERLSRRIARKIVQRRADTPISTTLELAEVCRHAYGPKGSKRIDPATRTFQALRIAVNGELDALEALLNRLPGLMSDDGLCGIISFHSLEDRLVKRAMLEADQAGVMKRVTRKPVTATDQEQQNNTRSRSAKLRVARKAKQASNPQAIQTAN